MRPQTKWGKPFRLEFMTVDSWYSKMFTTFSYFSDRLGFAGFRSTVFVPLKNPDPNMTIRTCEPIEYMDAFQESSCNNNLFQRL
jgi:hypothetical protein